MKRIILFLLVNAALLAAQMYQNNFQGYLNAYPGAGQYQIGLSSYDSSSQYSSYGNTVYRPAYQEYQYPVSTHYPVGSSYGRQSSPWYLQNSGSGLGYGSGGYGNSGYGQYNQLGGGQYGRYGSQMYDNYGYNPLLLNVNQQSSAMEQANYLSLIHDKENFQAGGCGYDPIQQRCTDGLGLCKGGCRDFSTSLSGIRDCRCIPYGYSALMKLITGYKLAAKKT